MKKNRTKPKTTPKGAAPGAGRSQVIKLRPGKPKAPWSSKLPPVKQYWVTTKQFLVEAVQELRKVIWPNRKETLGTTGVVLILVIIIAIFLGMVDFGLARLVRRLIY
jgi:preprotein translocase subunit SecE